MLTLLGSRQSQLFSENEKCFKKSFGKLTLQCSFEIITSQTFVVEYKLQYEALIVFQRIDRWSQ